MTAAAHDVDQMIDDAVLQPHDNIEVTQPNIAVDHDDLAVVLGETDAEIGGGGSFANAPLARCDDNRASAHNSEPPIASLYRVQSQSVHP